MEVDLTKLTFSVRKQMREITKIIGIDDDLIAFRTSELLNTNKKCHYLRKLLALKLSFRQVPVESPV